MFRKISPFDHETYCLQIWEDSKRTLYACLHCQCSFGIKRNSYSEAGLRPASITFLANQRSFFGPFFVIFNKQNTEIIEKSQYSIQKVYKASKKCQKKG